MLLQKCTFSAHFKLYFQAAVSYTHNCLVVSSLKSIKYQKAIHFLAIFFSQSIPLLFKEHTSRISVWHTAVYSCCTAKNHAKVLLNPVCSLGRQVVTVLATQQSAVLLASILVITIYHQGQTAGEQRKRDCSFAERRLSISAPFHHSV